MWYLNFFIIKFIKMPREKRKEYIERPKSKIRDPLLKERRRYYEKEQTYCNITGKRNGWSENTKLTRLQHRNLIWPCKICKKEFPTDRLQRHIK